MCVFQHVTSDISFFRNPIRGVPHMFAVSSPPSNIPSVREIFGGHSHSLSNRYPARQWPFFSNEKGPWHVAAAKAASSAKFTTACAIRLTSTWDFERNSRTRQLSEAIMKNHGKIVCAVAPRLGRQCARIECAVDNVRNFSRYQRTFLRSRQTSPANR